MFYQEKQIICLLNCSICKVRFIDVIKCLPCGEGVCEDCSKQVNLNNNREFKCQVCKEIHEMPKNGLPNMNNLMKLLGIKPEEISRGEKAEAFRKLLEDLNEKKIRQVVS